MGIRETRLPRRQVNQWSVGGTVAKAPSDGTPRRRIVVLGEEIAAGLIVTGSRGLGGIRRRSWAVSETRLSVMPTARHGRAPLEVGQGVAVRRIMTGSW